MKTVFIVDHIAEYPYVEQYGNTCKTYDEAMKIFAEAVHAYGLDDVWDGVSGICEFENGMFEILVIREISLPEN